MIKWFYTFLLIACWIFDISNCCPITENMPSHDVHYCCHIQAKFRYITSTFKIVAPKLRICHGMILFITVFFKQSTNKYVFVTPTCIYFPLVRFIAAGIFIPSCDSRMCFSADTVCIQYHVTMQNQHTYVICVVLCLQRHNLVAVNLWYKSQFNSFLKPCEQYFLKSWTDRAHLCTFEYIVFYSYILLEDQLSRPY